MCVHVCGAADRAGGESSPLRIFFLLVFLGCRPPDLVRRGEVLLLEPAQPELVLILLHDEVDLESLGPTLPPA